MLVFDNKRIYLILTILYCFTINVCKCYIITIDVASKECFYEKLMEGQKFGISFNVIDGGFLDIDFEVFGPGDSKIYRGAREGNGKYTFAAYKDGIYSYCFSNMMSTITPKVLMFDCEIETINNDNNEDDYVLSEDSTEEQKGIKKTLEILNKELTAIKREQDYAHIRDRIHNNINSNSNTAVIIWSCLEITFAVVLSIFQVHWLTSFVEVRRFV